jgi:hypothetical protein
LPAKAAALWGKLYENEGAAACGGWLWTGGWIGGFAAEFGFIPYIKRQ